MKNMEINATAGRKSSYRIIAKGMKHSENCRETGLNNNILVTGISGCGKTGSYVEPNMYSTGGSLVVVDTKGLLYRRHHEELERRGYKTLLFDFVNPENSSPYNPLDSVTRYRKKVKSVVFPGIYDEDGEEVLPPDVHETTVETYRQQDLQKIATLLIPKDKYEKDPFWPESAQMVLVSLMAYVLEVLPKGEQHFGSVVRLFRQMAAEVTAMNNSREKEKDVSFFAALEEEDPDSFAVRKYHMYAPNFPAEKCWASIVQFVANGLELFDYDENQDMLCRAGYDLANCGREKTAIFVNVSDTDRSMDGIVNVFYTQLFQSLCREADSQDDGRLKMPVHIMLDDFAANVYIPDFDKIVSVIRSREISVSIMLQSISQLNGMYNDGQASTIINNCDTMLYMGGQDVDTAKFFAEKAGKLPESILKLDLKHEWLFTRGQAAMLVEKIPPYSMTPDEIDSY